MSDYIEGLADRLSEAFGEPTLIPLEVKALLWDIRAESWEDGVMWKGGPGTIRPEREPNPYRKPPLELPTEPTWGIAIVHEHRICYVGRWLVRMEDDKTWLIDVEPGGITTGAAGVREFIPLTDEQVKRIKAAR